jgi:AAA-like domain/GUN4-like
MVEQSGLTVGGTILEGDIYVSRKADRELYEKLKAGECCCVLGPSQIGKSSLMARTKSRLQQKDGIKCLSIDFSRMGKNLSQKQWYNNIINEINKGFGLNLELKEWREQNQMHSSLIQLEKFFDILLTKIKENLVIFFDEIGITLSLPFTDDFFAFIRYCHNHRVDNHEYKRLTFCLLGIASPNDFIKDKNIPQLNIGETINLEPFKSDQLEPFKRCFEGKIANPSKVIEEIWEWTGGQPFLTQKLSRLMVEKSQKVAQITVDQVVRQDIIEDWETKDNPQHLRTIKRRIIHDKPNILSLLEVYEQILLGKSKTKVDFTQEEYELRLSGLILIQENKLRVYNKIYEEIFNEEWIKTELCKIYPHSEKFASWEASGSIDDSQLLKGAELQKTLEWSKDKILGYGYTVFLLNSRTQEERKEIALLNQKLEYANKKIKTAEDRNKELQTDNKKLIRFGNNVKRVLFVTLLLIFFTCMQIINVEYKLTNISELSGLIGPIETEDGEKAVRAEIIRQLGLSQSSEIKKSYNLQQGLLLSNIALAYQNRGNKKKAIKKIEESIKIVKTENLRNSLLAKEVLVYSLYVQGKVYKENQDERIAKKAYEEAFDLLQSNSNQFIPLNSETKIITINIMLSVHSELINLLTKSGQNKELLSRVEQSRKIFILAQIENLLKNLNLQDADVVTAESLWALVGTDNELPAADIGNLRCEDLRTIDNLWTKYTKYTNSHFGFSVQKSIWQSSEVKKDLAKFMTKVGWGGKQHKDGKDTIYVFPVTKFSLDAPEGQLPWFVSWQGSDGIGDRTALLNKIASCEY